MSHNKRLREKLAEIERQGFTVEQCKQAHGSHVKARLISARGALVTIIFNTSASDYRADKNFAASLRRLQQQEAHR